MLMRRFAPLLAAVTLAAVAVPAASPTALTAQAGAPDMSKMPPDILAIWKKVMSGGIPTPAEAARYQAYMDEHGGSAGGASGPDEGAGDCPARSPLLAQVATTAPGAAAAAHLLEQLRSAYLAKESADGRSTLESLGTGTTDAATLDWLGAALVVGQYPGAAVVVYANAAALGGATAQLSWSGLGSALEEAGDDAHAVTAFRRALALGPRNALDVYGLGVAYADLGDMSTGISLLTEATGMAPNFGLAWDALGRSQSCTGAMAMAAASMQKAQEVDWTENREKVARGPESDDDHVEARKPFPRPPGTALDPPPTPPVFPWTTPKLPDKVLQPNGFDGILADADAYDHLLTSVGRRRSGGGGRGPAPAGWRPHHRHRHVELQGGPGRRGPRGRAHGRTAVAHHGGVPRPHSRHRQGNPTAVGPSTDVPSEVHRRFGTVPDEPRGRGRLHRRDDRAVAGIRQGHA
jgi:tetratricopeptide (TPR) repeat protein